MDIDVHDHILDTMESWLNGEPVWSYKKIIETWGAEFEHWHTRMRRDIAEAEIANEIRFQVDMEVRVSRGVTIWRTRDQWTQHYGFAIPCAELLDALASLQPIIEVGAGTGYMTRLMMNRGIDVIGSNPPLNDYGFEHGKYATLVPLAAKTMVRRHPRSTIFCSWPTLKATWFHQMLKAMSIGQKLVVIREDACANDAAWEYLDDHFKELAHIELPVFDHMHDYAQASIKLRR